MVAGREYGFDAPLKMLVMANMQRLSGALKSNCGLMGRGFCVSPDGTVSLMQYAAPGGQVCSLTTDRCIHITARKAEFGNATRQCSNEGHSLSGAKHLLAL